MMAITVAMPQGLSSIQTDSLVVHKMRDEMTSTPISNKVHARNNRTCLRTKHSHSASVILKGA